MLKNLLILLLLGIFIPGVTEAGQEILVIQSIRIPPYEKVVEGFQSTCHVETERLIISEQRGAVIREKTNNKKIAMVLAIGRDALTRVKETIGIPVTYLMVLNPQKIISGKTNFTGVSIHIPQEKQISLFSKALPEVKNIGLVYDPDETQDLIKRAVEASHRNGINLIINEVHSGRDVPSALTRMKGKIDAFCMLPDVTVITPETVRFMLLFCLDNEIPVLTFSDKYVKQGALMSLSVDPFDLGCQAGEKANAILSGEKFNAVREIEPRRIVISFNLKIAKKLGLHINEDIISDARIID